MHCTCVAKDRGSGRSTYRQSYTGTHIVRTRIGLCVFRTGQGWPLSVGVSESLKLESGGESGADRIYVCTSEARHDTEDLRRGVLVDCRGVSTRVSNWRNCLEIGDRRRPLGPQRKLEDLVHASNMSRCSPARRWIIVFGDEFALHPHRHSEVDTSLSATELGTHGGRCHPESYIWKLSFPQVATGTQGMPQSLP